MMTSYILLLLFLRIGTYVVMYVVSYNYILNFNEINDLYLQTQKLVVVIFMF